VLIVHGTEDTLVAPQVVSAAAESMPKNCAALCWIDGGSHMVGHETPRQHVRAAWADGVDAPSPPCLTPLPSRRQIEGLNACGGHDDDSPRLNGTESPS